MGAYRWALCAAFAIAALCKGTAWAAPSGPGIPTLFVLELATDDADDQAKALTVALKSRIRASTDYALGDADVSLQVVLLALKCGDTPDAGCKSRIADKIKADRYLWGTLKKSSGHQVFADLHLWQHGTNEVRQQVMYSDTLTEPLDNGLQRLAEQILLRLTRFGKVGVVHVNAAKAIVAALFVDGKPMGRFSQGKAELTLPVGKHHFELRSGTQMVAQSEGLVTPSTTTEVDLQMRTADTSPSGETAEGGEPTRPQNWKRTAGFVGLGVGAILIGGGLYSSFRINGLNHNDSVNAYRQGAGRNICDASKQGYESNVSGAASASQIRDDCDMAATFKPLQYVLYALGVVAAGGGTYLLLNESPTEPASHRSSLRLWPSASKEALRMDMRFDF